VIYLRGSRVSAHSSYPVGRQEKDWYGNIETREIAVVRQLGSTTDISHRGHGVVLISLRSISVGRPLSSAPDLPLPCMLSVSPLLSPERHLPVNTS